MTARSRDLDLQASEALHKKTGEFDKFGRLAGQARDTSEAAAMLAQRYRDAMSDGDVAGKEIDEILVLFYDLVDTVAVLGDVCGTPEVN